VQLRANRSALLAALAAAAALSGCANVDLGTQQNWFAKKMDFTGAKGGYTFSELQESKQRQRPVTPNDLVDNNGGCAAPAAAPAPVQQTAAPAGQAPVAAAAPDTASLLGGGIALGMTECDVVFRAGAPSAVQIGSNPNGDRTATLSYNTGPRPGIYHFEHGQLMAMDRVAAPPPPPQAAKKKPTKSAKS
jgi:hypothetical protein